MPEKDMTIIEHFYTKWVKSLKNFEKFYDLRDEKKKVNYRKQITVKIVESYLSIDYGDLFLKCQKILSMM